SGLALTPRRCRLRYRGARDHRTGHQSRCAARMARSQQRPRHDVRAHPRRRSRGRQPLRRTHRETRADVDPVPRLYRRDLRTGKPTRNRVSYRAHHHCARIARDDPRPAEADHTRPTLLRAGRAMMTSTCGLLDATALRLLGGVGVVRILATVIAWLLSWRL